MGKINEGINSAFSGRVGNLIGSQWRGIAYMKSGPKNFKDPHTLKQIEQRSRLSSCSALSSLVFRCTDTTFHNLWQSSARGMTRQNMFVKTNIKAFEADGRLLDYSKIKMSIGSLYEPISFSLHSFSLVNKSVNISWCDHYDIKYSNSDNRLFVCLLRPSGDSYRFYFFPSLASRFDESASFKLPFLHNPQEGDLQVYMFFASADFSTCSNSSHLELSL